MSDPGLAEIAHDLYGRDPGEFVAARNEASKVAKDGGDKVLAAAIKALPKASTAAWVVNQLVRHKPAEVEELLAVGEALREATADADAAQLKDLNSKRRAVLAAMTRQARGLARELGHPVSDAIAADVEETLHAGLVDVAAGDAVRSGRLVAALSPAGFGSVDLTGAVAGGDAAPAQKAPRTAAPAKDDEADRRRAAELEQARAAAAEADAALDTATARSDAADETATSARERAEQAQVAVDEATAALRAARADLDEAEREAREAHAAQREAAKALTAAHRAADKAADALRALE